MASVLSTKKLAQNQKELLLNAGHSLVEHDLIKIVPLNFEVERISKNIIFTSKNAVRIAFDKIPSLKEKNIFCVGQKTALHLKEKGCSVKETANYGHLLAQKIVTRYPGEDFTFFCGKKRRHELPEILHEQRTGLTEIEVYDTLPVRHHLNRLFDGVLFFSPSAVKSFCIDNDLSQSIAFCIGKTTAAEAQKFTAEVRIATTPSVENVVVQVVKHFGVSRISS